MDEDMDEEEFFSSPLLIEQEGVLSVWLNVYFAEENTLIGWYDHDYAESGGSGPIAQAVAGYSYAESFSGHIIAAAAHYGITEVSNIWILYGHRYDSTPGPLSIQGTTGVDLYGEEPVYFLGVFPFTIPQS